MKDVALSGLKNTATEVFSSIIVFCPNFPPAAQTNTAKKFDQLTDLLACSA